MFMEFLTELRAQIKIQANPQIYYIITNCINALEETNLCAY